MTVQIVRPQELQDVDVAAWTAFTGNDAGFDNPFFHPQYVRAIADFRPQVEVAVIRENGEAVGFLPYERHANGVARPLGIKLADFQGVVGRLSDGFRFETLLAETGLSQFHFDHWLTDEVLVESTVDVAASPFMDLSGGYDDYLQQRRKAGSRLLSQTLRKQRKLEREIGPLTFTWNDSETAALDLLWKWKAEQRERTKTFDILQVPWTVDFLQALHQRPQDGLNCTVSTVRLDEAIIAVHLGMHTATAFHYWFPAYDTAYSQYSPGSILLLQIAEQCAKQGITRIDLGKGEDRYKSSFASSAFSVAAGTADRSAVRRLARTSVHRARTWIKNSPLRSALQLPKRVIYRLQIQKAMQPQ